MTTEQDTHHRKPIVRRVVTTSRDQTPDGRLREEVMRGKEDHEINREREENMYVSQRRVCRSATAQCFDGGRMKSGGLASPELRVMGEMIGRCVHSGAHLYMDPCPYNYQKIRVARGDCQLVPLIHRLDGNNISNRISKGRIVGLSLK